MWLSRGVKESLGFSAAYTHANTATHTTAHTQRRGRALANLISRHLLHLSTSWAFKTLKWLFFVRVKEPLYQSIKIWLNWHFLKKTKRVGNKGKERTTYSRSYQRGGGQEGGVTYWSLKELITEQAKKTSTVVYWSEVCEPNAPARFHYHSPSVSQCWGPWLTLEKPKYRWGRTALKRKRKYPA